MCKDFSSLLAAASAAALLLAAPGCGSHDDGALSVLELQYEAIDLAPGAQKQVKVESGKAAFAETAKNSGLTTRVEGDNVTIAAAKTARRGKHAVTVRDGNAKQAIVMVNVADPSMRRGR
jgi:hypothetical protein